MAKKNNNKDKVESFTAETPSPPAPTEAVAVLPVGVLNNVVGIIDMVTQRGGFRGEELFAVGFTRQRVWDAIAPHLTPQQA